MRCALLLALLLVPLASASIFTHHHPAEAPLKERFEQVSVAYRELITGDAIIHVEKGPSRMVLHGVRHPGGITVLSIDNPKPEERIVTDIAVSDASVRRATITLASSAPVAHIVRCGDYSEGECHSGWERTNKAFVQSAGTVTFEVSAFSAYGGVQQGTRLYATNPGAVNHGAPPASANLSLVRDNTLDETAQAMSSGEFFLFLNASGEASVTGTLTTTHNITFQTYWITGDRVTAAYATHKAFLNGALVCQAGDDNTGGYLLTTNANTLAAASCNPAQNHTISPDDTINYVVTLWAQTIAGGPAGGRTATLMWDTATADTWLQLNTIIQTSINVTTDQAEYDQGATVTASGHFRWDNQTPLSNRNVTVNFFAPNGTLMQSTNTTTMTGGDYEETLLLSQEASAGVWIVNVTGWESAEVYSSNATSFIVNEVVLPPPSISALTTQSITNSSATITWSTDEEANSTVEYSTDPLLLDALTQSDATLKTAHYIELTNLQADTTYYYRVSSCNEQGCDTSETRSFQTALSPGECRITYLEQGLLFEEGAISEGDVLRVECTLQNPIREQDEMRVRLLHPRGELQRTAITPRLLAHELEVVWP
jgi:hypothetical protein